MKKAFTLTIVVLGTIGVLSTMIGSAIDNPGSPLISALQTFRYFTIQSNLIVIVYFWLIFSLKLDKNKKFNDFLGGVTVYITITFLVFAIMLAGTWNPNGVSQLGNILNHYITPLLTIGFLVWYRQEYNFEFSNIKKWIIYPLLYVVFVLIHGSITSDYIYPFFEVDTLGIWYFLISVFSIVTLFLILSSSLVFLTKKNKK